MTFDQRARDEWPMGVAAAVAVALTLVHVVRGDFVSASAAACGFAFGMMSIPLLGFVALGVRWVWGKVRKRLAA